MTAVVRSDVRPGEYVPTADQRVSFGATWADYETQLAMRGERSLPRISFLRGTLELMNPSRDHERIASWLGRLVEIYGEETGIELSPYRSWTLKHPELAGAEPDECYIVGVDQSKLRPDLVIEVVWTRGGIAKLEICRHLGVSEVWIWQDDAIEIHVLGDTGYGRAVQSRWLPDLDLDLLCTFLSYPLLSEAKRAYRAALR